jgi:alkylhydroperoxidase/carboxymuconolactone decarboxylase family protein YurZ
MDVQELERHLDDVRRKRGYLLPHHGLMATALPGMLEDYDRLYSSIALTPRHLERIDHEVVWLVVLITVNESLGTHHLARYREAGGDEASLRDIVSLAGFCRGASAWCFVADSWATHLPDLSARDGYEAALLASAGGVAPRVAHLAVLAAHACAADWRLFDWQLEAAYAAGVDERHMAEALSLVAFPGSVPNFARACGAWQAAILAGRVNASDSFQAWAELTGQGGYDEAAGVDGQSRR